jgi:hypothetical protein
MGQTLTFRNNTDITWSISSTTLSPGESYTYSTNCGVDESFCAYVSLPNGNQIGVTIFNELFGPKKIGVSNEFCNLVFLPILHLCIVYMRGFVIRHTDVVLIK